MSKEQRTHRNKIYVKGKARPCPLCDVAPELCLIHRSWEIPEHRRKQRLKRQAALARVWDKGYHAAIADVEEDTPTSERRNPYRKRRTK